ncbi:MAG: NUDIX domain-containing protein [Spirochaetota bacterium]
MPTLTYTRADAAMIPTLAEMNLALLEQQAIEARPEPKELETRIRNFLADGYQAVLFRWDGQIVGYALYRLYPKYAYIRHFYLERGISKKLRIADAFSLLRNEELSDYASLRLDVPESAKESLQRWESIGFRPRSVRLELQTARKRGTRKSCGAVIYRKRFRRVLFLVVEHESGGHWGFPKGHVVARETEMETARREIAEETGLHVSFRDGFHERLYYLTPKERRKEVVFFLARVRRPRLHIQRSEIRAARWLPYWETRELLTYENSKLLLDKANAFIHERGF